MVCGPGWPCCCSWKGGGVQRCPGRRSGWRGRPRRKDTTPSFLYIRSGSTPSSTSFTSERLVAQRRATVRVRARGIPGSRRPRGGHRPVVTSVVTSVVTWVSRKFGESAFPSSPLRSGGSQHLGHGNQDLGSRLRPSHRQECRDRAP